MPRRGSVLFPLNSGSLVQPRLLLITICAMRTLPGQTGFDADHVPCPVSYEGRRSSSNCLSVLDNSFFASASRLLLPLPQDWASMPLLVLVSYVV